MRHRGGNPAAHWAICSALEAVGEEVSRSALSWAVRREPLASDEHESQKSGAEQDKARGLRRCSDYTRLSAPQLPFRKLFGAWRAA
jgi:hypothetical protein